MVRNKSILVTGSNGQLGKCLKKFSKSYNYKFLFKPKNELDITKFNSLEKFLQTLNIDVIINCAAYTNVNNSEIEKKKSELVNVQAVNNLAKICKSKKIQLIHLSTDYVFNGNNNKPYLETDQTNPINHYGLTKLKGENSILKHSPENSIIIRTSWLYSKYKNNFVSEIIKKINNKEEINIISDETGSPTNANDLAKIILDILPKIKNEKTEIFHFSNSGFCSRYELAFTINQLIEGASKINHIFEYNTSVKRPKFSVLNSEKIIESFKIKNLNWLDSLNIFLNTFKKNGI